MSGAQAKADYFSLLKFVINLILDRKGRVLKKENKNKKKYKKNISFFYMKIEWKNTLKNFLKIFPEKTNNLLIIIIIFYVARNYSFYALFAS